MWAIETLSLRKVYGRQVAVENLTLQVGHGEVFGFLGPNGAGKTTAVKMLLGLVRPTSGQARILGRPLEDLAVKERVGFLPEQFRFHEWLRVEEFLHFHGRLYGLRGARLTRRVQEVLELVGLADRANDQLRSFSKGMLQRVGLAQALINEPEVVFLDEPTSGLDPLGRRLVRDIIGRLRSQGVTVFLNSHLLSEVERVCDQVAILDRGRVVRQGSLGELLAAGTAVEMRVDGISPELLLDLRQLCHSFTATDSTITATIGDIDQVPLIAEAVVRRGARLYSLTTRQESLEDLFVRSVEGDSGA